MGLQAGDSISLTRPGGGDAAGLWQRRRQRGRPLPGRLPGVFRRPDEPAGRGPGHGGHPLCHALGLGRGGRPGAGPPLHRLRHGLAGPGRPGGPGLPPAVLQPQPGRGVRGACKARHLYKPQQAPRPVPGLRGGKDRLYQRGGPLPGVRGGAGRRFAHRRDAERPQRLGGPRRLAGLRLHPGGALPAGRRGRKAHRAGGGLPGGGGVFAGQQRRGSHLAPGPGRPGGAGGPRPQIPVRPGGSRESRWGKSAGTWRASCWAARLSPPPAPRPSRRRPPACGSACLDKRNGRRKE